MKMFKFPPNTLSIVISTTKVVMEDMDFWYLNSTVNTKWSLKVVILIELKMDIVLILVLLIT
jgi:hypothetical protein